MNAVLKGYLRLMRLANLPTAMADIFAGIAITGYLFSIHMFLDSSEIVAHILYLVFASTFLYAGGVVLNDVFDYKLDQIERPERPIPSGLIPLKSASIFGAILLIIGIVLAFLVNTLSGSIAIALALAIVLYDAISKKNEILGPLNMGVCRGLNLILGMSIIGELNNWWYAVIPVVYIFAITLISRGEVHGGNKKHLVLAGVLYACVLLLVVGFQFMETGTLPIQSIPFLLLFMYLICKPLYKAYQSNTPQNIKKAVISGVLSIIVLDAAMAVCFTYWWYGLLILLLLPLSVFLSKLFAVT